MSSWGCMIMTGVMFKEGDIILLFDLETLGLEPAAERPLP